jgi:phosphoribosylanthranilate isomerase
MWIKICGIKDIETAGSVAEIGVDAVGLNFYEPSSRCVDVSTATEIVSAVRDRVEPIGLFVNHSRDQIQAVCEATKLSSIQLHGDESPDFIASLHDLNLKVYRAFRVDREQGCQPVAEYLERCAQLGVSLAACLIDSFIPGEYGGTGHSAPWDLLAEQYDSDAWPRLIVAGGLTPKNVADAIQLTAPFGVDVASGVESNPGVKDLDLVRQFVAAAK